MSGPETLYARLTSGRPGTIDDVATELRAAVLGLAAVRQHIVTASDVPDWESPSARTQFNMRAWATEAMAQVAQVRCDRAKLAVEGAAAAYDRLDRDATRVIRWWRRENGRATDALTVVHLREEAMRLLTELRTSYGTALDEARDIFESADLSDWQERWMENGLARMMRFDLEDPTDVGPPIPDSLLTGDDDGSAAQGLGFDPRTGDLLQTSYNADGEAVLSVIDPGTGEVLRTVDLAAAPGSTAPDHAGGVSVDGDRVYVSSSGDPAQIYEYSLKDIRDAAPGDPVEVQRPPQEVGGGAYHTINNGTLYVGTHNPDGRGEVFTYTRNERTGEWENEQGPYEAPPKAQGVAVHNGIMYFSASRGRGNDSTLYAYDMATGEELGTERLPNMAEGLVPTTHGLMVTYESGSSMYDDTGDGLVPPQDMWPATSMTVTPYSELGVDGGIDVEPPTLQEASVRFGEADASLTRIEGEVDAVELPADALGEVPEAATFSQGLTSHLDTTAQWLRNGHLSAELTTEGLVQAAEEYVKTDDGVRGLFDNGRRFLQQLG